MVNIKQFLDDYNIQQFTEGKNTQAGWINIQCPFCQDNSNHGGFNISGGYYNCWQCGGHNIIQVIIKLLECSYWKAKQIVDEYEVAAVLKENKKKVPGARIIEFPKGTGNLQPHHKKYLIKRGFDPEEIINLWGIRGTSHLGPYKFRIIIPITLNDKIISYTARDITDRAELRYKACAIEKEVVHHKHIVYGADYVKKRRAIISEGPTDVWRIGPGSLATFGTAFTPQQILFLCNLLDEAYILFDNAAKAEAYKLGNQLGALIDHVEVLHDYGAKDPDKMSMSDIKQLRKNYLN